MYFIGYDIGSSSVKACLLDGQTGKTVASATSPDTELPILALQAGWAEQDPHTWWEHLVKATAIILKDFKHKEQISAIGISYQMHGLVAVNKEGKPLRNSIIWCDSRAVSIGNHALEEMGKNFCLHHYLNSPGNFTASKLKWVKENEPKIYEQIHKIMLPGDYIAYLLSGKIQTTITGLSEGILWDFAQETIATDLLKHYGIDSSLIPEITDNFKVQATLQESVAHLLGLPLGIPITYRAGDQPNNAFSLQVLHPGEIAATAGTSGVVYGVNKQTNYDPQSRVNNFAHVNHKANDKRIGILLCVNGTGIANSWMRRLASRKELLSYPELNEMASQSEIGAKGIRIYPFGNGAERMLSNQDSGARMEGLQFNIHTINDLLSELWYRNHESDGHECKCSKGRKRKHVFESYFLRSLCKYYRCKCRIIRYRWRTRSCTCCRFGIGAF